MNDWIILSVAVLQLILTAVAVIILCTKLNKSNGGNSNDALRQQIREDS